MQPTILVVEDHTAVRASLVDWLRVSFPECRILDVASAEEALCVAEAEVLTMVIMDIRLPYMDGLEATRQIKARQPRSRIVILSLYDDLAQRARASAMGASVFVSKQTMHAELLPVIEALLPRRVKHASSGKDGNQVPLGELGERPGPVFTQSRKGCKDRQKTISS